MNSVFELSKFYKKIKEKFYLYSKEKIPFHVLGNLGSKKEEFLRECFQDYKIPYSEINLEFIDKESILLKYWKQGLQKGVVYLRHWEKLNSEFQKLIYIQIEELLKNSQELPWLVSSSDLKILNNVSEGKFREDLFYRLSVGMVKIEPLQNRKNEILPIAQYYLSHFNKVYKKRLKYMDSKLIEFLLSYHYPLDWEQLESIMEQLVIMGKGKTLTYKELPLEFLESTLSIQNHIPIVPNVPLSIYEREIIRKNLLLNQGNREKTARVLKISVRTLYRKIEEYGLRENSIND